MPIRNLGVTELLIILVLAILIFGPGRIGKIGTELGRGIRGFKEGVATDDKEKKGEEEDVEPEVKSA
jgi:sec-independent protein translocase protein TatA